MLQPSSRTTGEPNPQTSKPEHHKRRQTEPSHGEHTQRRVASRHADHTRSQVGHGRVRLI